MFTVAVRAYRRVHLAALQELPMDARPVILCGATMTLSARSWNHEPMDSRLRVGGAQNAMSRWLAVFSVCRVAVGAHGCRTGTTFSYSPVNAPFVHLDGFVSQDVMVLDEVHVGVTGVARRPQIVGMHA